MVAPPAKIVVRKKDDAAYILSANKVYVCSASKKQNGPKYMEAIEAVAKDVVSFVVWYTKRLALARSPKQATS